MERLSLPLSSELAACPRSPPHPLPHASLAMANTDGVGGRRKNLALLRHKLYMGERRRTEPVVESSGAGEHGALRRSQSDRTEYGQKLQGTREACWVLRCPCWVGAWRLWGAVWLWRWARQALPRHLRCRTERFSVLTTHVF